MKTFRTPNEFYGWLVFEELRRLGLKEVFIAPGSRSTPLVMGAHAHSELQKTVHHDERGLGFAALGAALASRLPTAIVVTSGTAVANLLPAVIEASQSRVPLLILTADRPFDLRNTGANQAIDQVHIFGRNVALFREFPTPSENGAPQSWLTTLSEAFAVSLQQGPVHLNFPFEEPLVPPPGSEFLPDLSWQTTSREPWSQQILGEPSVEPPPALISEMMNSPRPLIVAAGQLTTADQEALLQLAEALQAPVIPDILSGLRFAQHPHVIAHADWMSLRQLPEPSMVIWMGERLQSKRLNTLIGSWTCPKVLINSQLKRVDSLHQNKISLQSSPASFCQQLVFHQKPRAEKSWVATWQNLETEAKTFIESLVDFSELTVTRDLVTNLPEGTLVHSGSSRPIRDFEAFSPTANIEFFCNRGASGIDGNLATFAGLSLRHKGPAVSLIGDLTLLHDLPSLALLQKVSSPRVLIIINNDGGGIFSFLPVANEAEVFETYFGTPHGLNLAEILKPWGKVEEPENLEEFASALNVALAQKTLTAIVIKTDRRSNLKLHREVLNSWKTR